MTGPATSKLLIANVVATDASDYGLGTFLSQKQDGIERVIAYASRTMSKSELHYETTRKELLAVDYGLKQFRQYLLGRHFVIQTDHAALSWLRKTPEPVPQLAWWLTLIEQYDYEVVHRHGKQHTNADGLSRRPTTTPITDDEHVQRTRVQTKEEISSVKNNRRTESACALASDDDSDLTMVKSVDTRLTPVTVNEPCQLCQSEATVRCFLQYHSLLSILCTSKYI